MYNQIVFMTSNRTKLAHLRHIGKNLPIPINLFHEQTYHATYNEPRIYNRDQLLKESVDSALEQIRKAKKASTNRLFLIEDTSVIIEALSNDKKEVPGLDVKYWMKDVSFEELDRQLEESGNRKVMVRSDMVLFNADKTLYQHFTGISLGTIVEHEHNIKTHLLYPWLDNKTFNKWFVPEGESKPISLLSIEKADLADFRKQAFDQIIKYISETNLIDRTALHQPSLFATRKLLIIVGYSCAGKTTLAQYIGQTLNVRHIEASDFMRLAFNEIHGVSNPYRIEDFAQISLKLKPEIVAEKIILDLNEFKHQTDVIVTGFRSPQEAKFLEQQLSDQYEITTIQVDADFETRFKRAINRKRPGDATQSKTVFQKKDSSQKRMGIEDFKGRKVENLGSIESFFDLFKSINEKQKLIEKPQENVSIKLGDLRLSVMLFLKVHYDLNGQGRFFTTTEMSKEIEHHKDNISRFFNQSFSADFETKIENDTVKYRLSNTGYSKISLYEFYQLNTTKEPTDLA